LRAILIKNGARKLGDGKETCLMCSDFMEAERFGICDICWEKVEFIAAIKAEPADDSSDRGTSEELNVFKRPGMESACMNLLEWRQNAFETRLNLIDDFLEIRDSAECDDCLSNRIVEGMNATTDALNNNITLAEKALEQRLVDRLKSLEERLAALETWAEAKPGTTFLNEIFSIEDRLGDLEGALQKQNRAE
jgi:hypothetical protein